MTVLLIATALFGLILGRFFKVYILIPTCGFALALALAGPTLGYKSLTYSFLEIVMICPASRSATSSRSRPKASSQATGATKCGAPPSRFLQGRCTCDKMRGLYRLRITLKINKLATIATP